MIEGADLPADRRAFLAVPARAMAASCRTLAGETVPYEEEVRLLFDVEPARAPETVFEAAAEELQTLLPGEGPVPDRLAAWREGFEITPERARRPIDLILAEARARTAAFVDLPEEESIELATETEGRHRLRFITDPMWRAYVFCYHAGRDLVGSWLDQAGVDREKRRARFR